MKYWKGAGRVETECEVLEGGVNVGGGGWGRVRRGVSKPTHLNSPNFSLEVLYKPTHIDRQENQLNKDPYWNLFPPLPPSPHT